MDVGLSPEQQMFGAVASKLASDIAGRWDRGHSPADVRPCVPSPADWSQVVDAGWLALRLDEESGGVGGSTLDVCVLAEQLGYHAVPASILGTVLLLEQLQLRGADPELLAAIASGEHRVTSVLTADLRDFATAVDNSALAFDTAGVEHGVIVGAEATELKVDRPISGADLTRNLSLIVDPASTTIHPLQPMTDEITSRATAFALTVISADMLGIMQTALDSAVEHARLRQQFGVPIGTFQAIQHLAAECLVSVEATRSAIWYSAWCVDELSATEALHAARTTKAFASSSVIEVVETAIQIFGGIGMTWESPAHIWQRRAHLDRRLFGDEHYQYALLADIDTPRSRES